MKPLILSFLLLLSSVSLSAQWKSAKLSEEEKRAEYREKIGIDMSVPDFEVKKGDELAIMMKLQLHKNSSGSKQTNLLFYFIDGVSEDNKTNELFLQISRYVQY